MKYEDFPKDEVCCAELPNGRHCKVTTGRKYDDGRWICHIHDDAGVFQQQRRTDHPLQTFLSFFPATSTPALGVKCSQDERFSNAWWDRLEFIMSTIKLHADGTPASVLLEWIREWDFHLNQKELLDALHGLGHPIAMQLQGSSSGASRWVVRPVPAGSRPRRPALCPS